MAEEPRDSSGSFRGARFEGADFTGATFRDCDLRGVRFADAMIADVTIGGMISNLVVNDVDVTAFVAEQLDRRHPERLQLRAVRTPDDYRRMWDTVEELWSDAVGRARRLPDAARHRRVDGEWSFVETLRHLVFATDAWVSRTVLDEPMPYARLGLPHTAYPRDGAVAIGIDVDAQPSFDEVMEVRTDRLAVVRRVVDALTEAELERTCTRAPAPGYPDEPNTVGECLRVVMGEECEHYRYATRDLAVLEA